MSNGIVVAEARYGRLSRRISVIVNGGNNTETSAPLEHIPSVTPFASTLPTAEANQGPLLIDPMRREMHEVSVRVGPTVLHLP